MKFLMKILRSSRNDLHPYFVLSLMNVDHKRDKSMKLPVFPVFPGIQTCFEPVQGSKRFSRVGCGYDLRSRQANQVKKILLEVCPGSESRLSFITNVASKLNSTVSCAKFS